MSEITETKSATALPLTPALKSYGISLVLHGTVLAALCFFPAVATERFASMGRSQVVSVQATLGNPPATTDVSMIREVIPLASEPDSLVERMVPDEDPDPVKLDSPNRSSRYELPELDTAPNTPELKVESKPSLFARRPVDPTQPDVKIQIEVPRPQIARTVSKPPASSAIPVEQFVGLDDETSADLSSNLPPPYPPEAVRQNLEGVVLLQLLIAKTGKIEHVELIKSSGHQVLDEAAIDAVSKWQGRPAQRWGRAVESVERLPVRFRL